MTNESPAIESTAEPQAGEGKSSLFKVIILIVALLGAAAVVHFTPIRAYIQDVDRLGDQLSTLGLWVYPVSIFVIALLVSCGVPRLLFCAAGGMIFDFWLGLLITQIATLLGYYGVFFFVRWAGHEWATRKFPKLHRLGEAIERQGIPGVILIRQLPVHGTITNLCLGLSHVKHRDFLIGTAIGILTEAVPATLIGAGVIKASLNQSAGHLAAAVAVFALIWIACSFVLRKMRSSRAGAAIMNEAANDVH